MSKKLISTTIIPDNLYVERNADNQLKNAINNMGRPASILVSRQMGKTNLLLNVKQKMQDENTLFIYIDLSNAIFNDIRDCFRFIIDTIMDTNLNKFEDIENKISTTRLQDRLPNREHEQELLILLKHFKGKLVIILDEIDSMKKYIFSDQFFSQIRSVYFASRSNYMEFNNLTYVLSGVLEPSEIIHDKTKSPFNISEKIYLNDFTREEYELFIKKLDFNFFDDSIVDTIYYWSNGHPRMTWDICSKLEDVYNIQNSITVKDIEDIINELYINHSDTPPIDNIKILISEDTSLAQSILDIKQKIFFNISDAIKNKLYLFGIIEIEESETIKIKNKILEENLTEDFLKNIIYSQKSSFEIAEQLFFSAKYNEAIVEYERFLNSNTGTSYQENISLVHAGLCLYYLKQFDDALECMEKVTINKDISPQYYYMNELNKGLCLFGLKEYKDSLDKFDTCLNFESEIFKIEVYVNLAYLYLEYNTEENKIIDCSDKGIKLSLEYQTKNDAEKSQINDLLANLYYIRAEYHLENKAFEIAKSFFDKILNLGVVEYKPLVLVKLINMEMEQELKKKSIENIFEIIKENKLQIHMFNNIKYGLIVVYEYVYILVKNNEDQLLKDFLNFCQNTYTDYFSSKCSVLLDTGVYFSGIPNKLEYSNLVLKKAISFMNSEMVFSECYKDILLTLVYGYFTIANKFSTNFQVKYLAQEMIDTYFEYLNFVNNNALHNKLKFVDYTIMAQTIYIFLRNKKFVEANQALKAFDTILENFNPNYDLLKTLFFDIQHMLAKEKDKLYFSKKCIKNINDTRDKLKDYASDFQEYINTLESNHVKYIQQNSKALYQNQKVQRNELCSCGSGKKYKRCCLK